MHHDRSVASGIDRCQHVLEHILRASDLHHVASTSLTIFAQRQEVAREMLQAPIRLETQQMKRQDIAPGGQEARMIDLHTRTGSAPTWIGEVCLRVRTFQWSRWGASRRPDDHHLGVPEAGACTDDGRCL
jgi:hypothetical protein